MKIYKTQAEVDKDIVNNTLTIRGDVKFEFHLKMEARLVVEAGDIEALNIEAWDIKAGDIEALNIKAWDIEAWDIEALNIKAGDIKAWDIEALNIKAGDIEALNIKAWDIEAWDISFYGVCWSYFSLRCKSIIGRGNNSKYFCLDKEVEIVPDLPAPVSDATTEAIELLKKNGYESIKH